MKTWMIVTAVLTVLVVVACAWAWLRPNPHVGDAGKLRRTFSAAEQTRLETVRVTPAELAAATCPDEDSTTDARCWLAVDGVVYDMSGFPWWMRKGTHHGITAGTDATAAFVKSGHAVDTLQSMPVVGRLNPAP